jgi:signal peptidase I
MAKSKRGDLFGVIPDLGDIIVFNPPRYKGLIYGECIGFTSVGLPRVGVGISKDSNELVEEFVPKTGFVVKKKS